MIAFLIVFCAILLLLLAYGVSHLVNRRRNRAAAPDGFLCNQHEAPARQLRYGFFRSSFNGCGWIAAYNACRILGEDVPPAEIISDFERYGAVLFGLFGTRPAALTHFFRKRGYRAEAMTKRERFDALAKAADACVLWFWHRRGAHFFALQATERGYVGYNVYSDATRPVLLGASLSAYLKARNYHAPRLLAVQKEASANDEN